MSGPWEQYQSAPKQVEAGPWTQYATPDRSILGDIAQGAGNLAAGAVRGAGSIGATLLAPIDIAKDALAGRGLSLESNRQRRTDMDAGLQTMGAEPDSMLYKGGKVGAEIAGTMGVGGAVANGARAVLPTAVASSPLALKMMEALATGGFRTGAPAATTFAGRAADLGIRAAGGAVTGGASAGLVDPESAGTGAVVGAALPPAITGAAKATNYVGRVINSVAQPFTQKGQQEIAGNILKKFAEGGPTTMNSAEIVPGSVPTLAEATGNAGIARLQSAARDLRPNAFVERETANAAARNAAFDNVAGDAGKLDFFRASRSEAASDLYGEALKQSNAQPATAYVKGQITQLLKRPSIDDASRAAQKLALERGERPAAQGSLQALHDVKTALDDKISEAVRAGKGGEAEALQATKGKLLDVMEKLSPAYKEARITYTEMSQPVNQMEVLQGLRITDAKGNITLSKIQNALDGLERKMNAPGANPAKSLADDQINVLKNIREDLLRQSNLSAGKSAGSNTFQNIATDNILGTLMPGKMGGIVNNRIGDVLGQVGKLAYSGPNEKIRNVLVDSMLDPAAAQTIMSPVQRQLGPVRAGVNALADYLQPSIYRAAPVLTTSR
jgi:hypothetical protein